MPIVPYQLASSFRQRKALPNDIDLAVSIIFHLVFGRIINNCPN
jgi:hypothetical protein